MRIYINLLLLSISLTTFSQNKPTAELLDFEGIILFHFIPENEVYHCKLKSKIIIDSVTYNFIENNDINASILRKYKGLQNNIGVPAKIRFGRGYDLFVGINLRSIFLYA